MSYHCLKCRTNTEIENPKVVKARIRRIMPLSKCTVCGSKKLKFMKQRQAKGLISNLIGEKLQIQSDLSLANIFVLKV